MSYNHLCILARYVWAGYCKYMNKPQFLQFNITQEPDGGYNARSVGYSIFTQGNTLDETLKNIREATECHFDEDDTALPLSNLPILANFEVPSYV